MYVIMWPHLHTWVSMRTTATSLLSWVLSLYTFDHIRIPVVSRLDPPLGAYLSK